MDDLVTEGVGFLALLVTVLFYWWDWWELRVLQRLNADVPPGNLSILPFTSLFLSCLSLVLYGLTRPYRPDLSMVFANSIGLVLGCYAFFVLLRKFPPRQASLRLADVVGCLTSSSSTTTSESIEVHIYATVLFGVMLSLWQIAAPLGATDTRLWTGYIATVATWVCLSAPVVQLKHVIAVRDSSDMSLPYIGIAFLVSLLWMLYGWCLGDSTVVVQNLVSTLASAIEAAIYVFFWLFNHEKYQRYLFVFAPT